MSDALTRGIRIQVSVEFKPEHSTPEGNLFFFAYRIRITNLGTETVQLLGRSWRITDAFGRTERVEGPGVVGQQPVLQPGGVFEYTSFCPLATALGTMEGSYTMVTEQGERFDALIHPFSLHAPQTVH